MRYDPLSQAERSERMSRIRCENTKLELAVRKLIYGMGYRYRLQGRELPGRPDLLFRPRKKVIFVHGCFWHLHGCKQYLMPKSRLDFWKPKLAKNVQRDSENQAKLTEQGWGVLVIWECQLKETEELKLCIRAFLEG